MEIRKRENGAQLKKIQTIKELPSEDQPYERFKKFGAEAMSDSELLAILIRSGTKGANSLALAQRILLLCPFSQGLSGLYHLSVKELQSIPGIGEVKAIQLKCIGEISKRIASRTALKNLRFNDPQSIADFYMERLRHEEQEFVYCMMLDTKNNFLGDEYLSKGTVNSSPVSPRELFLKALSHHAVSIVLIHNHPSGDPTPSSDDIEITIRIASAGRILGIRLLDHIVIGDNRFTSLAHYIEE